MDGSKTSNDTTAGVFTPRDVTLDEAVAEVAQLDPRGVGWIFEDAPVTFAEMHAAVNRTAAALAARGVARGDRVAVWLPNKVYWPYCLFACANIGARVVALNTRWTAPEAAYVLRHSTPRLLVMQGSFLNIDFNQQLAEVRSELDGDCDFEVIEVDGNELADAKSWEDIFHAPPEEAVAGFASRGEHASEPGDAVLLQYTSGTTAKPKGALISHVQILNYGVEMLMRVGVQAGDVFLNTQPLYHVGGSCGALPVPLTLRCTIVMPTYYEAGRILSMVTKYRPVARSGTEAMYIDEMNHPTFSKTDVSCLRAAWTGVPPALFDKIRSEYPIEGLVNLYGATEGGGTVGEFTDDPKVRRVTVGKPLSGCQIVIMEPGGAAPLGAGAVGEICFRGWNRMIEYFDDPERTAATIDADGFVHSGDLGFLDEDGYLHFSGRIKEMIRPGGENVAAEEVEAVLIGHPEIRRVAVIAAPDLRLREVVMAIVERGAESLSEDDVKSFCTGKLAGFRIPRYVRFTTDWPLTATGKIERRELRRIFVAEDEDFRATQVALDGTETEPIG